MDMPHVSIQSVCLGKEEMDHASFTMNTNNKIRIEELSNLKRKSCFAITRLQAR